MPKAKKRFNNEINASSMADIAFLLLIFFLVTTTINVDKGILHKLPPYVEDFDIPPINKRNVLEVNINARDEMLVENEYLKIRQLRAKTKKFLTNNGRDPNLSDNPKNAVVSLKNDKGTSYDMYIQVQNELKAAYRELRDDLAKKETDGSMTYDDVVACASDKSNSRYARCKEIKDKIKDTYPMKISEAEPESLGGS